MTAQQTAKNAAETLTLDAMLAELDATDGISLDALVEETAAQQAAESVLAGVSAPLFTLKALRAHLAGKGIQNSMRRINESARVSVRVKAADLNAAFLEIEAFGVDVEKAYKVNGGFYHLHLDAAAFYNAALGLKPAACAKGYKGNNNGFKPVMA